MSRRGLIFIIVLLAILLLTGVGYHAHWDHRYLFGGDAVGIAILALVAFVVVEEV